MSDDPRSLELKCVLLAYPSDYQRAQLAFPKDMIPSAQYLEEITTPSTYSKNKTNHYDMMWIQLALGRSQVTLNTLRLSHKVSKPTIIMVPEFDPYILSAGIKLVL